MSGVIIAGNTSGSVTLDAPAVAGSTVITLPTTSGTMITTASSGQSIPKAALPTGSVLQVVTLTGASNTTTSSSTFIDTGLTLSITPTSATSKILVFYNALTSQTGASIKDAPMQLLRNSTVLVSSNPYFNTLTEALTTSGNNYLDSPATTSATTYKIQVKCNNSSSVLVYGSTYSSLTLMEISA